MADDSPNAYPEALALDQFASQCSTLLGQVSSAQNPACPASRDLSTYADPELVQIAFGQGVLLASVASDQIKALVKSLTEPVLTIAPWSIARNVLESSSIASWIMDPDIDAHERVSRSTAFRFAGLKQQVKFVRATGYDTAEAEDKIDQLEQRAQAAGHAPILDRNGNRTSIAQRMPTFTDLVASVFDCEVDYRLFSAMTHAQPWALSQLAFKDRGPAAGQVVGVRMRTLEKSIPRIGVKIVCMNSADALYKTSRNRATLFGVGFVPLQASFEDFINVLAS